MVLKGKRLILEPHFQVLEAPAFFRASERDLRGHSCLQMLSKWACSTWFAGLTSHFPSLCSQDL